MSIPAIRPHRWTRLEYEKMAAAGILRPDEKVELIDGDILERTPQSSRHAAAVGLVEDALRSVCGSRHVVRVQMPLILDEHSEPEPDVAVVVGTRRDYRDLHPTAAILVVEVADTSLSFDRLTKKAVYARAGILEYWILNLIGGRLEVHRDPEGETYRTHATLGARETVSPISLPQASISVADLLP